MMAARLGASEGLFSCPRLPAQAGMGTIPRAKASPVNIAWAATPRVRGSLGLLSYWLPNRLYPMLNISVVNTNMA
jgi:hypothetical protein